MDSRNVDLKKIEKGIVLDIKKGERMKITGYVLKETEISNEIKIK